MATKYTKNVQKLLNNGLITKQQANNMMINTGVHIQSNNIKIIRNKMRRLRSFSGSTFKVNKNRNNIQNKLKNNFIGNYKHINISGSFNQCYARTTLFVLLLYINRNANSFRDFLRIINSNFSFELLEYPSLTIDEQSIINRFSQANNGEFVFNLLRNILSFDDDFIDTQDGKTYEIKQFKWGHAKITNEIKRNPLEIILICKDKSIKYGGQVEIKLKDYITDRYEKVSFINRNKIKIEQIDHINRVMGDYYNKIGNKELVIETFIKMYNNSKLFNSEIENKILRDYFKYWRLKIQIRQYTSLEHIISEIKTFLGGKSYAVFIPEFLYNIPFFNSLVFYNYNIENKKLSIIKYGNSISIGNLGRNQIYNINAPVLVGRTGHQEVAVNNKFFADLNKNNWPKYNVESNVESNQRHNNGGVGRPKLDYLEYARNTNGFAPPREASSSKPGFKPFRAEGIWEGTNISHTEAGWKMHIFAPPKKIPLTNGINISPDTIFSSVMKAIQHTPISFKVYCCTEDDYFRNLGENEGKFITIYQPRNNTARTSNTVLYTHSTPRRLTMRTGRLAERKEDAPRTRIAPCAIAIYTTIIGKPRRIDYNNVVNSDNIKEQMTWGDLLKNINKEFINTFGQPLNTPICLPVKMGQTDFTVHPSNLIGLRYGLAGDISERLGEYDEIASSNKAKENLIKELTNGSGKNLRTSWAGNLPIYHESFSIKATQDPGNPSIVKATLGTKKIEIDMVNSTNIPEIIQLLRDSGLLNTVSRQSQRVNKDIVRFLIGYYSGNSTRHPQPNQFRRNANMTGQPKPVGLTNANRTKMKEFLKSKIPNSNINKNVKKLSINDLNDEHLLKDYLIEKESNNQLKDVIKTYNLRQLLKTFKLKESGGGGTKGGSSFVYVSKIGRRKLRYTKTGRKFIINKGKRKYLK